MKNLKNSLTKPSPDNRLWALWVWNKKITEDEMVRQLNAFIDKGFGSHKDSVIRLDGSARHSAKQSASLNYQISVGCF